MFNLRTAPKGLTTPVQRIVQIRLGERQKWRQPLTGNVRPREGCGFDVEIVAADWVGV